MENSIEAFAKVFADRLMAIERMEQKLDKVLNAPPKPTRISAPDYIRQENISRQTFYNRAERGMFQIEKIGGRNYVVIDTIKVK